MINKNVQVKVYQQTKKGETDCGDSYFYIETKTEFICVLADGLGSGTYAKESSQIVIEIVQNNPLLSEEQLIQKCTEQLQGKRGAVLGLLKLDFLTNTFTYASIGNIGFVTKNNNKKKKRHIPQRGYLSGYKRPLKKSVEKLKPNTIFVLYSDGVLDSDLLQTFNYYTHVSDWIETFPVEKNAKESTDDTTIIAMYYKGNK